MNMKSSMEHTTSRASLYCIFKSWMNWLRSGKVWATPKKKKDRRYGKGLLYLSACTFAWDVQRIFSFITNTSRLPPSLPPKILLLYYITQPPHSMSSHVHLPHKWIIIETKNYNNFFYRNGFGPVQSSPAKAPGQTLQYFKVVVIPLFNRIYTCMFCVAKASYVFYHKFNAVIHLFLCIISLISYWKLMII